MALDEKNTSRTISDAIVSIIEGSGSDIKPGILRAWR